MMFNHVSTKLVGYVGTATVLLTGVTFGITYWQIYQQLTQHTQNTTASIVEFANQQQATLQTQNDLARERLITQMHNTALARVQDAAHQIDGLLRRTEMIPRAIAARQQGVGMEVDGEMVPFIANLLALTPVPEAFGATIAYDFVPWDSPLSMPWVDRQTWPQLNVVEYNYADGSWPWFSEPKRTGEVFISEPYFDAGGSNVTMVTISHPVYTPDRQLIGIATVDLELQEINQVVQQIKVSDDPQQQRWEYGFLASREGNLIVHPRTEWMLRPNERRDGQLLGEHLRDLPGEGGVEIAQHPQGITQLMQNGEVRQVYWATAPRSGWKVALNIPPPTIDLPTPTLPDWTPPDIDALLQRIVVQTVTVGIVGVSLLFLLVYGVGQRIGQRIRLLSIAAEEISQGKLDHPIDVRGKDEIAILAVSFQRMQRSLGLAMQKLRPN